MRQFFFRAFLLAIGIFLGFAFGHHSNQSTAKQSVPVACYDSQGKAVPDPFVKFGGVRTACAPGQVASISH